MPFITEEIWQTIPHDTDGKTVMLEKYPEYDPSLDFPSEAEEMMKVMEAITAIRTQRNEMNVPPSKKAMLFIASDIHETFSNGAKLFKKLS